LWSPRIRGLVERNLRSFAEEDKSQDQPAKRLIKLNKEQMDVQSKLDAIGIDAVMLNFVMTF
jgi:hypothetical protein